MSNQTLQKSPTKRRTRTNQNTAVRRQTARLEGRRDGKPLIFGWGTHLSRTQKTRIKKLAAYIGTGIVVVAIVAVFVIGLVQQNIIIPNETIVTVNGIKITQDAYRKQLAYDSEVAWNNVENELKQYAELDTKVAAGDATATAQQQSLQTQIQADEGNYSQSTLTENTTNELVEDQLIQQGEKAQFPKDYAKLQPTQKAINDTLASFKKAFPAGDSYSSFLSSDTLSDSDVKAAIAVTLRRGLLQTYLANALVSPAKQVHLRLIQTSSSTDAAKVLQQLQKDNSDASWSTLAKQDSVDTNSKDSGGDKGWLFKYETSSDAAIELWAFDPSRKVGDMSGVIADAAGTYDVVQILGIDPSRTIDATTLSQAKNSILDHWLSGERHLPRARISSPDQNMMNDTRNLPKAPDLNATLPSVGQQQSSGG